MTVPDPPARAALLAGLPALGFVPPEDAAPWARVARPARVRPRTWAHVTPVPAWEPERDTSSVPEAVAAYRRTLAENEAAVRGERVGRQLERVAGWLIGGSTLVIIGLGTVVVVFATVCGCLGSLVR